MKHIMLLGALITLVILTSSLFAGNPGKVAKTDDKQGTLIIDTTETTGKNLEKEKQGKAPSDEIDEKKVEKEKEKGSKEKGAKGQADESKLKKDNVVGSVVSINNLTGEILIQEENKKTERTVKVDQDTLRILKPGDKVNIELAPGANTAENVSIIAEGKDGSKSKGKKKK